MKPQRPLNISERLERGVNELKEIFTNMRDLEFTHVIDPTARDLTDYTMLVDDLAATLQQLTSALQAEDPQHITPATLAARDFPPSKPAHPAPPDTPAEPPTNSPTTRAIPRHHGPRHPRS
ncbi:hypothetical protein J4573_08555 [Actinomadura barringtoniae]|uniref:Uncharacterized protein n=1 Tax=Actinomadura barringtoniae TaxID=1427535 RepID=A0A939PCH7_9ACTN|nr:hypothetical protein [Actinomadura barringtoniae]MBO2447134.1 hypothetical protein [Actinomadura barringtoniae]